MYVLLKASCIILDSSMVEHAAVNRGVVGSSPTRGVYFFIWTLSSVGQSNRLITDRSWVRVPEGPLKSMVYLPVDFLRYYKALWLSWLERRPVTAEVGGSSPPGVVIVRNHAYGILAQLGEHLPYKQRVIGSSPIGPIEFW